MAVNTFPAIQNPDYKNYTEGLKASVRRADFEGNTVSVRPAASLVRRTFTAGWTAMPNEDKAAVFAFFSVNAGKAFWYTPPLSSTPVLCMFADDGIDAQCVSGGKTSGGERKMRWTMTINFEEITTNAITANADAEEETEG